MTRRACFLLFILAGVLIMTMSLPHIKPAALDSARALAHHYTQVKAVK